MKHKAINLSNNSHAIVAIEENGLIKHHVYSAILSDKTNAIAERIVLTWNAYDSLKAENEKMLKALKDISAGIAKGLSMGTLQEMTMAAIKQADNEK